MDYPRREWKNIIEGARALAINQGPYFGVTEIGTLISKSLRFPIYELNRHMARANIDLVLFWNGEIVEVLVASNQPLIKPPFFTAYMVELRAEEVAVNQHLQQMHGRCSITANTYNCKPFVYGERSGVFQLRRLQDLPCLLEDITRWV